MSLRILLVAVLVVTIGYFSFLLPYRIIKNSEKVTIKSIDSLMVISLENAYFEGQKDYMNGDVRISRQISGKDTTYTILKSFWNNGDSMVFKP